MDKEEMKNEEMLDEAEDTRDYCKYGANCYQRKPDHHKKFRHPPKKEIPKKDGDSSRGNKQKTPEVAKPEPDGDSVGKNKRKTPEDPEPGARTSPEPKKRNVSTDEDNGTDTPAEKRNDSSDEAKNAADVPAKKQNVSSDEGKDVDKPAKKQNVPSDEGKDGEKPPAKKQSVVSSDEGNDTDVPAKKRSVSSDEGKDADEPAKKRSVPADERKDVNAPAKPHKEVKVAKPVPQPAKVEAKLADPRAEAKKTIAEIFLVSMPDDFYKFYDFCNELKPSDPATAFKIADLQLVGPYDVLTGLLTKSTPSESDLLTHWRYYYDPPEFQTIIKGNDREGLHFGYWRDRPSSDPVFVATNCSEVSHKIKPIAENIFGAIVAYLEERVKKVTPFEKTGFFNLLGKLKAYAKKHNISLETQSAKLKSREKNVVARTIHGAGIVCPYNKKSQVGYRELSVTDNQLLKIVKKINDAKSDQEREGPRAELGEVVRLATIAGDECDFGTCLELGHDLLSTGSIYVQNAALAVLNIAYTQLEREAFLKIVEAHMESRKKGCNVSALTSTASTNSN